MYSRLLSRPSRRKAIPFERLRCRRQLVGHRPEPVPRSQPADRRNTRHSHGDDAQRRAPSGFHQRRGGGGTAVTAASCSPAHSIPSSSGPPMLTNDPARGSVRAVTDLAGVQGGKLAHAGVARFVVDQLTTDTWLRRTPVLSW